MDVLKKLEESCPLLCEQFENAANGTRAPWAESLTSFVLPSQALVGWDSRGGEEKDAVEIADSRAAQALEDAGFTVQREPVPGLETLSNYRIATPEGASLRFPGQAPGARFSVEDSSGRQIAGLMDAFSNGERLAILCIGKPSFTESAIYNMAVRTLG